MHRLVIIHIVIALSELSQVLPVTIRLASMHALETSLCRILPREARTTFTSCVRVDSLKSLQGDIALCILRNLILKDIFYSIWYPIDYD